jgi:endonuclease/exonuclease/phosphatase family metal-dependent hydrolase
VTKDLHPDLEHWRANVGESLTLDHAPALSAAPTSIDVLCWNVAIGKGRLTERLRALTAVRARVTGDRPLVVLVQEAYRTDDSVPESNTGHHGGKAPRNLREDIADGARATGFSLRYAPSMRNGDHRSDRGNAILSSVAIAETHWLTLPYVRQRRAAIAVKLAGAAGDMWFANAHLDTHGRHRPHPIHGIRATQRGFGAGRVAQAAALAESLVAMGGTDADLVLGGDLNSYLGLRDPVIRELVRHGFRHSERVGRWRHTFHGPIRLMLDHVMFRPARRIERVQVTRLDEGMDRSSRVFGSDHHPLLATLTIR